MKFDFLNPVNRNFQRYAKPNIHEMNNNYYATRNSLLTSPTSIPLTEISLCRAHKGVFTSHENRQIPTEFMALSAFFLWRDNN